MDMNLELTAAAAVSGLAAIYDWRTGHIPNWLTLGAMGAGVVAGGVLKLPEGGMAMLHGVGGSVCGIVLCGLVPAVLFRLGGLGGGDVKLFAALGAMCHPLLGLTAQTYAFVAALLIAPIWLVHRGIFLSTMARSFALLFNPLRPKAQRKEVPCELLTWFRLGPAIFLGTLLMIFTRGGL